MKKDKTRAYCRRCRHEQTFLRTKPRHGLHLVFSILSLGLWSVCWLSICIGYLFRPWRCEHCRWHDPEFGGDGKSSEGKPGVQVVIAWFLIHAACGSLWYGAWTKFTWCPLWG